MKLLKTLLIVFLLIFSHEQRIYAIQDFVYMTNGRLYFPNGKELSLWGVNFQPCLSWEYNNRFKRRGVQLTSPALKAETDSGLEELQLLGVNLIRIHLTPADFTDTNGNLVQTVYLDILDYMISEASKRNMYVYITFINHMKNHYVSTSAFNDNSTDYRQKWIFDKTIVAKSKTYITALLNRTNPYTLQTYKSTPSIALFEILNEPSYFSYDSIQTSKRVSYYKDYLTWINTYQSGIQNSDTYSAYRTFLVKNYINDMWATIRNTGAMQPIVWNCNWANKLNGNTDIFQGISQSNAEVVSFCCYPGQNLIPSDYWNYPVNLSTNDFTDFFKSNYNNYNGYGWARSTNFIGKAKVCYEFEQFFNQSSYLYPLMAQYFRSLGVQVAAMWTYNFGTSAPYAKGSHFLSLSCTPAKAASFVGAHQIFDNTKLYTPYNINSPNEQVGTNFGLSKTKDLSTYVSSEKFYYTGTVTNWLPLSVSAKVTNIIGRGNSPFVQYSGSGVYIIQQKDSELYITLEPNYIWLMSPTEGNSSGKVTQLDNTTANLLSISLENWGSGSYNLYSLNGIFRQKISVLSSLKNMLLVPGKYIVSNNTTSN